MMCKGSQINNNNKKKVYKDRLSYLNNKENKESDLL